MQNSINNPNGATNEMEVTYAGFFPRFIAFIIDIMIAGIASFIITNFMMAGFSSVELFTKPLIFTHSIVDIFAYILKVSYFIVCICCTQTTVGKYIMKLKVVGKDLEKLSVPAVIYRETIGRFLSSFLFVGYFLIFIQKDKAALHDILVDSRVIYSCTVKKTVLVRTQAVAPAPSMNPYVQFQQPMNNIQNQAMEMQNQPMNNMPNQQVDEPGQTTQLNDNIQEEKVDNSVYGGQ